MATTSFAENQKTVRVSSSSSESSESGENIRWIFTADTEWVRFWVYNITPTEALEVFVGLKESLPQHKYFVHSRMTENIVIVQYHHKDFFDTNECGLLSWAETCCEVVGRVITARDSMLAVPHAAVEYDFKLRYPRWAVEDSESEPFSEMAIEHVFHEITFEAFRHLNGDLYRELKTWAQVKRMDRALLEANLDAAMRG